MRIKKEQDLRVYKKAPIDFSHPDETMSFDEATLHSNKTFKL